LVVDDDRLVGGLALEEERRLGLPCLRVMGGGRLCPDHLDLLAAPSQEDTTISLLRSWLHRPGGRLLDLKGIRAGSRLIEALPGPARRETFAVAPWTPLPNDAPTYLASLPSQFRRQIRRSSARLAAEGATHRTSRGLSAVRSLDTLRELHQAQWGDRSRFLPEFNRFASGCRLGAEADEVVVHELATEERVISTFVAFEVAGRVSLYQSARLTDHRWRDAAAVLLTAIFTDACDRGFTEVDFLRGEELYKNKFAPRRREMIRLLAGSGVTGRVASASERARSGAGRVAVRTVRASRAAFAQRKP
jgi:CelD/BcsL family acetyltransferase involved in cellulose biosynthesis